MSVNTSITCPSCHTTFPARTEGALAVVCPSCSAFFERSSQTIIKEKAKTEASTLFPIGQRGQWNNRDFEIVGWVRYRGSEDGESFTWHEWHVMSGRDSYWIEEDSDTGNFILHQRIDLSNPIDIQGLTAGKTVTLPSGESFRVSEVNTARAEAFGGELDWTATQGESLTYVDGSSGSTAYSIEDEGADQEVFKGEKISRGALLKAFGVKTGLSTRGQNETKRAFSSILLSLGIWFGLAVAVWYFDQQALNKQIAAERAKCEAKVDQKEKDACLNAINNELRNPNSSTSRFRSGSSSFGK